MNKHRKAEARRVKALLQSANACGCRYTYRRVRRQVRQWDRDIKALPRLVGRAIHKGIKRTDYGVSKAVKQIADGLKPNIMLIDESFDNHYRPLGPAPRLPGDPNYVIDETPMKDTSDMWPKENPHFSKKYLGKWNLPKEETE